MQFLKKLTPDKTPATVQKLRQVLADNAALDAHLEPFAHQARRDDSSLNEALAEFDKSPGRDAVQKVLAAVREVAMKTIVVEHAGPARGALHDTITRKKIEALRPVLKSALKAAIADLERQAAELTRSYRAQAAELGVDVAVLAGPIVQNINARVAEAADYLARSKGWTTANTTSAINFCLS